jgi:transposase
LEGLPDYQFAASANREDGGFLGLLLRRPRHRVHPTKHAVAVSFLFDNWEDFWKTYQSMCLDPGILTNSETRSNQDARTHLKAAFLKLVTSDGLSISDAARRSGINVGTATTWARQHNIQFRRRPKVMHPGVEITISDLLIQGIDRDEVAKEAGVSRQAVDRLLQGRPDLKEEWSNKSRLRKSAEYRRRFLETISCHPGLSIKAIRSIPGNGFQWLYRHDSEWLSAHLPSLWISN